VLGDTCQADKENESRLRCDACGYSRNVIYSIGPIVLLVYEARGIVKGVFDVVKNYSIGPKFYRILTSQAYWYSV